MAARGVFPPRVLGRIRKVVAVTSCKGGVGKSTVSHELARALAARGHRVGLFDADVHGPSLPTQVPAAVSARGVAVAEDGWSVRPLVDEGVACMSFGWLGRLWSEDETFEAREVDPRGAGSEAALAVQLLHTTAWGTLDFLILDTPPGTGEIPRAMAARAGLAGCVVVTTPSKMAHVDVVRGVAMLARFGVPVVAVVENMASFKCDGCGKDHFPFGRGHLDAVLQTVHDVYEKNEHGELKAAPLAPTPSPSSSSEGGRLRRPPDTLRLPIIPDDDDDDDDNGGGGGDASRRSHLAASLDTLAEALERDMPLEPVSFPALAWHERPNWIDKLFFAARGATRTIRKNDLEYKINAPSP